MTEYFVITISLPAPFVGDTSTQYIEALYPMDIITQVMNDYKDNPYGLFSIKIFNNADEYHKNLTPVIYWITDKGKEWIANRGYKLSDFGYINQ